MDDELTADAIEHMADIAEEHWREVAPDSTHWLPVLTAAREAVKLKRMPINSETLHKIGFLFQGLGTYVSLDAPVTVQTDMEGEFWMVRIGTRAIHNVGSAWDLLELVRMARNKTEDERADHADTL